MSALSDFADTLSFGLVHTIRKRTHFIKDHVQTIDSEKSRPKLLNNGKHLSSSNILTRLHSRSCPSLTLNHSTSVSNHKNSQLAHSLPLKRAKSTPPTTITAAYSFESSLRNSNDEIKGRSLQRSASLPVKRTTRDNSTFKPSQRPIFSKNNKRFSTNKFSGTALSSIPSASNSQSSYSDSNYTILSEAETLVGSPRTKQTRNVRIVEQPVDLVSGEIIHGNKLTSESLPSLVQDDDSVSSYSINPEVQYKVVFADNVFPGYP